MQKKLINVVGLRGNGCTRITPVPYSGNAESSTHIHPADVMTLQTTDGHCDLQDTLAAAACAVRQGTQAFRTDPNSYAKGGLALVSALVTAESRKAIPSSKKYARVFEASLGATSWGNIFDQVDFGPGRPTIILGGVILTQARSCVVTKGPGGDGFCARCASLKAHLDSCKAAEHLSSLHRRPFSCEQQQPALSCGAGK